MSSLKQLKTEQKIAGQQLEVIRELEKLVQDIERAENTITTLKAELEEVNVKHQARKTTREDIAYLNDLLKCAHKKLAWEKQIASLQKRTPAIMEHMAKLINDPSAPGDNAARTAMLASLQKVQAAMERLQGVKVE
jgi:chromosome segregation ATPase